jgi:hypothetical protein
VRFVSEESLDELAKSSTILQCIVNQLDFECNQYHVQPEFLAASDGKAVICCDPLTPDQIMMICERVNKQYVRKDKRLSCVLNEINKTIVTCEAGKLSDYNLA